MKKLMLLLVSFFMMLSLLAQRALPSINVHQKDGSVLTIYARDINEINFSKRDTSNVERDDYVVQEINTNYSHHRIPLAEIDSVSVTYPEKSFNPIITTGDALNVTESSATLTAKVEGIEGYTDFGVGFIANFNEYNPELFELYYGTLVGDSAIVLDVTGLKGNTYYIYTAIVDTGTFYFGNDRGFTTKSKHNCPDDNHPHLIDLGLPSGTKWACCNVDAQLPSDFGRFYAWGETSPKYDFEHVNYQYATGEDWNEDGFFDDYHPETGTYGRWQYLGDDIAGTEYDVAHVKWGDSWVMPSTEQFEELCELCTWEGEDADGVPGYNVIGPNGNIIFLPATDEPDHYYDQPKNGLYWSSTCSIEREDWARGLQFEYGWKIVYEFNRFYGRGVRPVSGGAPPSIKFADAAVKEICLTHWDTDGDGKLQFAEAEAVESLGDAFCQKQDITSFKELRFFKGLTSIGERAFMQCSNLSEVMLPKGVTWIEKEAFADCAFTSINLPDSLIGLGERAFAGNPLVSISLPRNLSRLNNPGDDNPYGGVFDRCDSLEVVNVDASNETFASVDGVLMTKDQKFLLLHPSAMEAKYNVPEGVEQIHCKAFRESRITGIRLPSTLKVFYMKEDGEPAFNNKLMNIRTKMMVPFECDEHTFEDETYAQVTLLVPEGTKTLYETTRGWSRFEHIEASDQYPVAEAIDLGLPSGTKWASWNIGATSPEEFGSLFAWGETEEKDVYNDLTYKYSTGEDKDGSGYYDDYHEETDTYGVYEDIGDDIAGTEYDVAHVQWGGEWTMPSSGQFGELLAYCDLTWTTQEGVAGKLFTGPNGNSIFLPSQDGRDSSYWSSSLANFSEATSFVIFDAYWLFFPARRGVGLPVRPVCK